MGRDFAPCSTSCRCRRRLLVCPCQGLSEAKSFAALNLGKDVIAPEQAYVTVRFVTLLLFGNAKSLLFELLPVDGAQKTGAVQNGRCGSVWGSCESRSCKRRRPPVASWLGWTAPMA